MLRLGLAGLVLLLAACDGSRGDVSPAAGDSPAASTVAATTDAAPGVRPEQYESAQPVFEIPLTLRGCDADAAALAGATVDAARALWAGALEIPHLVVTYQPGDVRTGATSDDGRGAFVTTAVPATWAAAVVQSGAPAPCTPEAFAELFVAALPTGFITEADERGWFAGLGGSGDTAARLDFVVERVAAQALADG